MKRLMLLIALLACGDAAAFRPGALGGHSGLGRNCGALGNCGAAPAVGFPKSAFVFAAVGNSIPYGQDAGGYSWARDDVGPPHGQLSVMLSASGASYTMNNKAHPGYSTGPACGGGSDLTALVPSEIDTLYDGTKNNVLIFQEVINDIYCGSTGAQAYAHVTTYMRTLAAGGWYKIVIMPTPRDNGGVTQPTYENERQNFITLVNADPTFGSTVHAVWRVDQDTRLGSASSDADGYYYYLSGTSDTKVHWLYTAHAIAAAALMDILRAKDSIKFPYIPQHAPWLSTAFNSASAGSVLTTSGGAATNGQVVATWVHDGALESGNAAAASHQLTYSSAGFGGHPAVNATATTYMDTAGVVSIGRGMMMVSAKDTSNQGGYAFTTQTTKNTQLIFGDSGSAFFALTIREQSPTSSQKAPSGSVTDGNPHVLSATFNGTLAGQRVWVDGNSRSLTVVGNSDSNTSMSTGVATINGASSAANGLTGLIGDVYASSIEYSTHERSQLEACICSRRALTCTGLPTVTLGTVCAP